MGYFIFFHIQNLFIEYMFSYKIESTQIQDFSVLNSMPQDVDCESRAQKVL